MRKLRAIGRVVYMIWRRQFDLDQGIGGWSGGSLAGMQTTSTPLPPLLQALLTQKAVTELSWAKG